MKISTHIFSELNEYIHQYDSLYSRQQQNGDY